MFGSGKDKNTPAPFSASKQIDTVIAEQCTLEGDLTAQNSIKLDGRIHGTLRCEGSAVIGETGLVKGDVYASDLLVLGRLEGNVHAGRLHLQSTAQIQGNIEAETLQVDPGARSGQRHHACSQRRLHAPAAWQRERHGQGVSGHRILCQRPPGRFFMPAACQSARRGLSHKTDARNKSRLEACP